MKLKILTDGGSRSNPGHAAIGVVIEDSNGKITEKSKYIGVKTNNVAEYTAVREAIDLARGKHKNFSAEFFIDSELIVKQLNGEYKVKDQNLKKLYFEIKEMILNLDGPIKFTHVKREQNKRADALVNKALDKYCGVDRERS